MSRQIQIRRGTTNEHASFIGAIGEVTMDTDKKTLCIHDGETAGGFPLAHTDEIPNDTTLPESYDFIIETVCNSSGWYRKYKSGWIEQGGYVTGGGANIQVSLLQEMTDNNYMINVTGTLTSTTAGCTTAVNVNNNQTATTYFYVNNFVENGATRANGLAFFWQVNGFSAS